MDRPSPTGDAPHSPTSPTGTHLTAQRPQRGRTSQPNVPNGDARHSPTSPTGTHVTAQGETLGTGQTPNRPGSLKGSNPPPAAFRYGSPSGSGGFGWCERCTRRSSPGCDVARLRRARLLGGWHRVVRFVRAVTLLALPSRPTSVVRVEQHRMRQTHLSRSGPDLELSLWPLIAVVLCFVSSRWRSPLRHFPKIIASVWPLCNPLRDSGFAGAHADGSSGASAYVASVARRQARGVERQ